MWKCNDLQSQINTLLTQYPDLHIVEEDTNHILLKGTIDIFRSACNFILQKKYMIEIIIPKNLYDLPIAIDAGNVISKDYPHRYTDGSLCLETNTYIRNRFIDGIDLVAWMDEFVEPYFFSYEFFCRYGEFPFGERPHGLEGLIHTYQEFWNEDDLNTTYKLMVYTANQKYRGHLPCPCGSRRKTRQCHGPVLFPYITDSRRIDILKNDLQYLMEVIAANEQNR